MNDLDAIPVGSHWDKLSRSLDHLYALEASVKRWGESDPATLVSEDDPETGRRTVRFKVLRQPTDPDIPILVGEFAHSVRSALDHLGYKLSCLLNKNDPPPNEGTAGFPIVSTNKRAFDDGLAQKIARKKLMPSGMYALIEGVQPYHGGDTKLLETLSNLDNIDKHRLLHIVAGIGEPARLNFGDTQLVGDVYIAPAGPLKDGAPVFAFTPVPDQRDAESKVPMEFVYSVAVAFGERSEIAPGAPVTPLLHSIRRFSLERVIRPLHTFLA